MINKQRKEKQEKEEGRKKENIILKKKLKYVVNHVKK